MSHTFWVAMISQCLLHNYSTYCINDDAFCFMRNLVCVSLPLYDEYLLLAFWCLNNIYDSDFWLFSLKLRQKVLYYMTASFLQKNPRFLKISMLNASLSCIPQPFRPKLRFLSSDLSRCLGSAARIEGGGTLRRPVSFYLTRLSIWREISKLYEISTILDIYLQYIPS